MNSSVNVTTATTKNPFLNTILATSCNMKPEDVDVEHFFSLPEFLFSACLFVTLANVGPTMVGLLVHLQRFYKYANRRLRARFCPRGRKAAASRLRTKIAVVGRLRKTVVVAPGSTSGAVKKRVLTKVVPNVDDEIALARPGERSADERDEVPTDESSEGKGGDDGAEEGGTMEKEKEEALEAQENLMRPATASFLGCLGWDGEDEDEEETKRKTRRKRKTSGQKSPKCGQT